MIPLLLWLFAVVPGPVPMTTIAKGGMSAIDEAREVVVRDAAAWKKVWSAHNWDEPPPAVDFTTRMVVGVFLGTRNTAGYAVEITGAEVEKGKDGDTLTVRYVETKPAPRDVTAQVLTMPFHLVSVPVHAGPVVFRRVAPGDRD